MTFRVLLLAAGAVLTGTLPVHAQKRGSVEVGAFGAYLNTDNSLPLGNAIGLGGRIAVNAATIRNESINLAVCGTSPDYARSHSHV